MPVEVEYARCSLMDRLRQVCRRYVESPVARSPRKEPPIPRDRSDDIGTSSYLLAELCLTWAGTTEAGDGTRPVRP